MVDYSHTRLAAFETCPLKYKFSYIDNIRTEEEGIEAFMGKRYHETMQKLYQEQRYRVMPLEEVLAYYEAQWDKEYSDVVIVTRKDRTAADYRALGRKCIEEYYKAYHPFDQARTLGVEQMVRVDLKGDGKYPLKGYVDRIAQAPDGTYEIHDYKTGGRMPLQKDMDEDRQLALYQLAIQGMWNDVKSVRLIWHFVVFNKELVSTRTPEALEKLKDELAAVIDRLESTKEFLPVESRLCDWCEHQKICPRFAHPCKVEELPLNEYLNDDGVKLVNTLRDLTEKRKKLTREADAVKEEEKKVEEAIIQFSVREGVQVVQGSGCKAKVSQATQWHFPGKHTPERAEVADILQEAGLWDGVVDLDTYALRDMIAGNNVPQEVLAKLAPYFSTENVTNVKLSMPKAEE